MPGLLLNFALRVIVYKSNRLAEPLGFENDTMFAPYWSVFAMEMNPLGL